MLFAYTLRPPGLLSPHGETPPSICICGLDEHPIGSMPPNWKEPWRNCLAVIAPPGDGRPPPILQSSTFPRDPRSNVALQPPLSIPDLKQRNFLAAFWAGMSHQLICDHPACFRIPNRICDPPFLYFWNSQVTSMSGLSLGFVHAGPDLCRSNPIIAHLPIFVNSKIIFL